MDRMMLRLEHREVEFPDRTPPTGEVELQQGASKGFLLTPSEIDPKFRYPLFTLFHGAGRQDQMLVKACRKEQLPF